MTCEHGADSCAICISERATCPICEGAGRIDLGRGEGVACDHCNGEGVADEHGEAVIA